MTQSPQDVGKLMTTAFGKRRFERHEITPSLRKVGKSAPFVLPGVPKGAQKVGLLPTFCHVDETGGGSPLSVRVDLSSGTCLISEWVLRSFQYPGVKPFDRT